MAQRRGFQEFEHTADWGIHVWAEDFPSLLCTAAEGMFILLEVEIEVTEQFPTTISLQVTGSKESLLVDFLNELLYLSERDKLSFVDCDLLLSENTLTGTLIGKKVIAQGKEIKAVTFHNLEIISTSDGYETRIVFDV